MATVWIVDDDHEMAQAIALMVELLLKNNLESVI